MVGAGRAPATLGDINGFQSRSAPAGLARNAAKAALRASSCRSAGRSPERLLLALSAKAKVVLGPVDMSLQTLAVLLIGATFGFRLGVATLLLYLAEGAAGLPVFQGTPEKGIGLAYMIGSTGGYLAGFLVMAAIVGWAVDRGWGRNIVKIVRRHAGRRDRHDGDGLLVARLPDRRRKVLAVRRRAVHRARPDQGGARGGNRTGGVDRLSAAKD